MAIASMHGIVKRYGSHMALDHVDLDIGEGEGEGGMKMSLRFHLLRFILLRMVRGYIGLLLLVGGPLALISVLGFVAGYVSGDGSGLSGMD